MPHDAMHDEASRKSRKMMIGYFENVKKSYWYLSSFCSYGCFQVIGTLGTLVARCTGTLRKKWESGTFGIFLEMSILRFHESIAEIARIAKIAFTIVNDREDCQNCIHDHSSC
jgi:hypothetical protein